MALQWLHEPGLQLPSTSDFQPFQASHILEKYDLTDKGHFLGNTIAGNEAWAGRAARGPTTAEHPNGQEMCRKAHLDGNGNDWTSGADGRTTSAPTRSPTGVFASGGTTHVVVRMDTPREGE